MIDDYYYSFKFKAYVSFKIVKFETKHSKKIINRGAFTTENLFLSILYYFFKTMFFEKHIFLEKNI